MRSGKVSLSSHLVIDPAREAEGLLRAVRAELAKRFAIEHTTIQIEPGAQEPGTEPACADACEPGAAPA